MCLFTPGWLIQDKYCIQIIVWKKSRSPFYHNGDPRGSRKTLLHCYAHFTDFRGGITNFPLGIHRCLRITSSPWVPPECIGRIVHTTSSRKKFQVQKFEILNKTKWLFTFLHHYVSFGSFLVFPFLCADFFCVFYVWSWTFRYC